MYGSHDDIAISRLQRQNFSEIPNAFAYFKIAMFVFMYVVDLGFVFERLKGVGVTGL